MKRDTPMPIQFMDSDADELEHRIRECGENMLAAYTAGDRMTATQWLELQRVAIKSRSPEQVVKLETEKGLRPGCYFTEQGEADRKLVA